MDKATDCDDCSASIPYGVRCWMVTRYYEDDGTRVVKVICESCYSR